MPLRRIKCRMALLLQDTAMGNKARMGVDRNNARKKTSYSQWHKNPARICDPTAWPVSICP
jgi:hypothetical protein